MALLLFEQIMSLFLILLLGFIIVKTGHLKNTDSKVLTVLSVYVILPVVIIKSFQIDLTPDIRDGFRQLDVLLGDLALEDNNTVFNLCCSLCTAYEHKAFVDGLQYGAHLISELHR